MLIIADRGFPSYDLWRDYMATGAALLWRVPASMHLDPITILPDGSYLAEIRSKQAQHTRSRIPLEVIGDLRPGHPHPGTRHRVPNQRPRR